VGTRGGAQANTGFNKCDGEKYQDKLVLKIKGKKRKTGAKSSIKPKRRNTPIRSSRKRWGV